MSSSVKFELLFFSFFLLLVALLISWLIAYANHNEGEQDDIAQSAIKNFVHGLIGLFIYFISGLLFPTFKPALFAGTDEQVFSSWVLTFSAFTISAMYWDILINHPIVQKYINKFLNEAAKKRLKSFFLL